MTEELYRRQVPSPLTLNALPGRIDTSQQRKKTMGTGKLLW